MSLPKDTYIIVSVGIWNDEGKFMMVEEGKEWVRGLWNFPSGKAEMNETLVEGAKREVLEETGCVVEITDLSGIYHYTDDKKSEAFVRVCFNCKLISENPEAVLESDILSRAWKTREEVEELIAQGKIRSKIAEKAIEQYFAGASYPIEVIKELEF